jgi:hypothetical protein
MRSACWVLGALTPGSVARPLHPEPHARVTRNNPPLTTQNPPLLGFNFFLNFLLAQRSFSFLYFRCWRCFLQTAVYFGSKLRCRDPLPRNPESQEAAKQPGDSQEAARRQAEDSLKQPGNHEPARMAF